jgi:hypothetical protein
MRFDAGTRNRETATKVNRLRGYFCFAAAQGERTLHADTYGDKEDDPAASTPSDAPAFCPCCSRAS